VSNIKQEKANHLGNALIFASNKENCRLRKLYVLKFHRYLFDLTHLWSAMIYISRFEKISIYQLIKRCTEFRIVFLWKFNLHIDFGELAIFKQKKAKKLTVIDFKGNARLIYWTNSTDFQEYRKSHLYFSNINLAMYNSNFSIYREETNQLFEILSFQASDADFLEFHRKMYKELCFNSRKSNSFLESSRFVSNNEILIRLVRSLFDLDSDWVQKIRLTMVHGDLHKQNIMEYENRKVLIDFDNCFYANPLFDFFYWFVFYGYCLQDIQSEIMEVVEHEIDQKNFLRLFHFFILDCLKLAEIKNIDLGEDDFHLSKMVAFGLEALNV
jgi:hypothetical protein